VSSEAELDGSQIDMGIVGGDVLDALAAELEAAERHSSPVSPLSGRYPELTVDDAYAIQSRILQNRVVMGQCIVGRKIGLTARSMQDYFGIDEPDFGHLTDRMVVADSSQIEMDQLIAPKVEAELAFVLGEELPSSGVTSINVIQATDYVIPVLEVIDSRIQDWKIKIVDTVADNAAGSRFVLGGPGASPRGRDLRLVGMVVHKNGEVVQTGAGAAVLGNPAGAVAWLANTLGRFGTTLKRGDIVLAGAFCAPLDLTCSDVIQAEFDGLGSVNVRFG
jgi:2-oxopent-4-enoate hydratase